MSEAEISTWSQCETHKSS